MEIAEIKKGQIGPNVRILELSVRHVYVVFLTGCIRNIFCLDEKQTNTQYADYCANDFFGGYLLMEEEI